MPLYWPLWPSDLNFPPPRVSLVTLYFFLNLKFPIHYLGLIHLLTAFPGPLLPSIVKRDAPTPNTREPRPCPSSINLACHYSQWLNGKPPVPAEPASKRTKGSHCLSTKSHPISTCGGHRRLKTGVRRGLHWQHIC